MKSDLRFFDSADFVFHIASYTHPSSHLWQDAWFEVSLKRRARDNVWEYNVCETRSGPNWTCGGVEVLRRLKVTIRSEESTLSGFCHIIITNSSGTYRRIFSCFIISVIFCENILEKTFVNVFLMFNMFFLWFYCFFLFDILKHHEIFSCGFFWSLSNMIFKSKIPQKTDYVVN